jgi:hypothetical protein
METARRKHLIQTLEDRFVKNASRHPGIAWSAVHARLQAAEPVRLEALAEMERTGGEPDVIGRDEKSGGIIFCDCSAESPTGRRSLCYDPAALESRKANKPEGSAVGMAASMGVELLNEEEYRALQELGEFDLKTSSWVRTPEAMRVLGGALFCDRRYGRVFAYHNGAESYYAVRGFRGTVRL